VNEALAWPHENIHVNSIADLRMTYQLELRVLFLAAEAS